MKKHLLLIAILCTSLIAPAQNGAGDINKVITHYLEVKDALAAGDGNMALSHAKDLLAAVKGVNTSSLSAAQRKIWITYEPRIEFDSRHISEVNRVEHQREHFATLSANLYTVIKALQLNDTPLYESYCNMTKKTFLSKSTTGKDPYMGMDNCSKVTETLPAHH